MVKPVLIQWKDHGVALLANLLILTLYRKKGVNVYALVEALAADYNSRLCLMPYQNILKPKTNADAKGSKMKSNKSNPKVTK